MQFVVNGAVIGRVLRLVLLAAGICSASRADNTAPVRDVPLAEWLRAGERQDFPWDVRIRGPWLTFQQRRLTQIQLSFRVADAQKAGLSLPDLYFVVKIGSEDGRWFEGQSFRHFVPPPDLKPSDQVQFIVNVNVQPGSYRVVIMAYDAAHNSGNLTRRTLQVQPLKDDPMPQMARNLPTVEFLASSNPMRIGAGRFTSILTANPWDLGSGDLALPVSTRKPTVVDVVVNVSLSEVTNLRHGEAPEWRYQINAATLLQVAHVLSQLDLRQGCVRLSMIDLRRLKIFVDHGEVQGLDWQKIRNDLETLNRNQIDVRALAGQKQEPAFLARYLERLREEPAACEAGPQSEHVLLIVSDAFVFPNGTKMTAVGSAHGGQKAFYLRLVPIAGPRWDEIKSVLKPLQPIQFDVSDARQFRRSLASIMERMAAM